MNERPKESPEDKVEATLPDGTKQWLLWVFDDDFRWQHSYPDAEPVLVPAGTRIETRFRDDNSADSPGSRPLPRRTTTRCEGGRSR